jgi:predicted transcriptional regulator
MKLSEYLEQHGIRKDDFAKMIGRSTAMIYLYISGDRTPKLSTCKKIKEITNGAVTSDDFMD